MPEGLLHLKALGVSSKDAVPSKATTSARSCATLSASRRAALLSKACRGHSRELDRLAFVDGKIAFQLSGESCNVLIARKSELRMALAALGQGQKGSNSLVRIQPKQTSPGCKPSRTRGS